MTTNEKNNIILSAGEKTIWRGKPKRSAFVATKSLTMLPIAIIWLIIDSQFILTSFEDGEFLWFIIPFFALHLMPVWIWLANVLTANRRWKNTCYFITNKRIVIQGGFFAVNEASLFYKDLQNTQLHIGFIDKLFHTGDVRFNGNSGSKESVFAFEDLENANQVYNDIQRIIMDIQTDIEFPNALRPEENPGYNTNYTP